MKKTTWHIHLVLVLFAFVTLLPMIFSVNAVSRSNAEFYRSYFAFPDSFKAIFAIGIDTITGSDDLYTIRNDEGVVEELERGAALGHYADRSTRGTRIAWGVIRPYMLNTLIISTLTAIGVLALGSGTAYILSRYKFFGSRAVFMFILSTMMFPAVLTLVPSFLLVKELGLLNTYWAMILPFVAGGQVFAIFVFKSFFEGLPEDLFESARIDGAGHLRLYWNIVLPMSKPVFSVVLIMNVLGTWNNFLWPFIVNPDGKHHMVASGLFVMANSAFAQDFASMYAAYALASIPLLILLCFATKPFIEGMTSGAFKA